MKILDTAKKNKELIESGAFQSLCENLDPETKEALKRVLNPEAYLSVLAKELTEHLKESYPEFLNILWNTRAQNSSFPASGIPAQSADIVKLVQPEFNAGIGIAHDEKGNIQVHPDLAEIFAHLKPADLSDETWIKVQNKVFTYTNGLGAPWYRALSRKRYLRDGRGLPELQKSMEKSLSFDPIVGFGGTSALSICYEMVLSPGTPVIYPEVYWGNMNLKAELAGAKKVKSAYLNQAGDIQTEALKETIQSLKEEGYSHCAVYFNFPHNPTGNLPTHKEALRFQEILQSEANSDFQIAIICDEPYYPFQGGDAKIRAPFSYYVQPLENRNLFTLVSINGTKRDGMYGLRHGDLMVLLPHSVDEKTSKVLEIDLFGGYIRGLYSFSNCLNQYFLGRAMSGDPLIPIRQASEVKLCDEYIRREEDLLEITLARVKETRIQLKDIEGLRLVGGDRFEDATGGFFLSFLLNQELIDAGVTPRKIHEAGLQENCGVVAVGNYVRLNALISPGVEKEFAQNLQKSIERAKKGN